MNPRQYKITTLGVHLHQHKIIARDTRVLWFDLRGNTRRPFSIYCLSPSPRPSRTGVAVVTTVEGGGGVVVGAPDQVFGLGNDLIPLGRRGGVSGKNRARKSSPVPRRTAAR